MPTLTEAVKCCVSGCPNSTQPQEEGISWIIAKDPEKGRVRVPVCKRHLGAGYSAKCWIESGKEPEGVVMDLLSYSDKDAERKQEKLKNTRCAGEDWEWEFEMDRWRTPEGEIVKMSRMSDSDIYDAIEAIMKTLEEKPRGFRWTEKIHGPGLCIYSADLLVNGVGVEDATAKLDEFKNEIIERGKMKI